MASSGAIQKVMDLLKSTATVAPLAAGTTYGASLISPTPNLTPAAGGWFGAPDSRTMDARRLQRSFLT
jgi:hypothetical protein